MIAASGLTFSYDTSVPIVDGLDAAFEPGSITALVGASGSGKSTLLYLVGLMLTAGEGSLVIDGVETVGLADWERAELRARSMGFIFQDALLDPARSVLDNVLEGALYNGARTRPVERAVQLLREFEVAVDPRRRPGQISGGQAQRVALCRAFVADPHIILADEPTGNLDHETADLVWASLRDRATRGAVVIVATHDRERAAQAGRIIQVGHGAGT